jgi:hypothetical protein
MRERAAQVAARVAILQPAGQDGVECCARHDPELPVPRHGVREPPGGHARAHAALDDHW